MLLTAVFEMAKKYQHEQQLIQTTLSYIAQAQEAGSGDYVLPSLELPEDASPLLRCLAGSIEEK